MASIFDSLAYDNGTIPDSVRRAAQGELDYQRAIRNKLPLSVEGSGIPEGVRKAAQASIERGSVPQSTPTASVPVGDPWMQGQKVLPEGLFGKAAGVVGKGLGGLGALAAGAEGLDVLNQKFGPGAYQTIKSAMEEEDLRRAMEADPELAQRGQSTVDRVVGGAMQGVQGLMPQEQPQPQGLTEEELNAQNPNEVPDQPPQQSPMEEAPAVEPTPVGPVVQAAPATVEQAAAKTAQEVEVQRQVIENGALKGLSTGAVSRPEFAEEIVKADAQKSGVTLTPEQIKKAATVELTNMKSMDNNEVSKYISYALMAAGVLAVAFDKTGAAGEAFSQSFNKQLDRNLAAGLQTQKTKAAAAKQAQDLQIALAKIQQGERGLNIKEKSVEQTGEYQQGSLEQRRSQAAGAERLGYSRIDAANARSAASNSLRQMALDQNQRQYEGLMDLRREGQEITRDKYASDKEYKDALLANAREKNLIAAKGVAAKGGPKGIKTDSKVAGEVVDQVLDSQNLNVSKSAKAALAEEYRVAVQNDPAAAADPVGTVVRLANQKKYQNTEPGFFNGTTGIRNLKTK